MQVCHLSKLRFLIYGTCLLSLCTSIASVTSAFAATEKLDFHQILERAQEKNLEYSSAKRVRENSTLYRKRSLGALLPSVDAKLNHNYTVHGSTTADATHQPWSNSLGLSVTEVLYDNGDRWRQYESDTVAEKIEALNLEKARVALLQKVCKAYFDYSAASASYLLQTLKYDLLKRQFESIQSRYHGGVTSNRDFLRIKSQLKKSELGLLTQRIVVQDTKAVLDLAVGESPEVNYQVLLLHEGFIENLKAPEIEVSNTLDYRISELQAKVSELKYRTVERADWPRLSLISSYNYNQPQYLGSRIPGTDDPTWYFQTSLTLEYSIWDWGIRRHAKQIAENQKYIEFNAQDLVRKQTLSSVQRLVSNFELLLSSYAETKQIVVDDENVFQSLNIGYRDGKVNYIDLITALGESFDSRTQILNLKFGLLKALADLGYYQGNIDEVFKDL
jgi:outer membrane protein TolC